jgi:hypothetical protein
VRSFQVIMVYGCCSVVLKRTVATGLFFSNISKHFLRDLESGKALLELVKLYSSEISTVNQYSA